MKKEIKTAFPRNSVEMQEICTTTQLWCVSLEYAASARIFGFCLFSCLLTDLRVYQLQATVGVSIFRLVFVCLSCRWYTSGPYALLLLLFYCGWNRNHFPLWFVDVKVPGDVKNSFNSFKAASNDKDSSLKSISLNETLDEKDEDPKKFILYFCQSKAYELRSIWVPWWHRFYLFLMIRTSHYFWNVERFSTNR